MSVTKGKSVFLAFALILFVGGVSSAKSKETPIYNHVGKIVLHIERLHYDAEAHISTDHDYVSAYCNFSDNSVDCTDTPGYVGVTVELEDDDPHNPPRHSHLLELGLTTVEGKGGSFGSEPDVCRDDFYHPHFPCDPLGALYHQLNADKDEAEFRYRRVAITKATMLHSRVGEEFYCVPFTIPDRKGKQKAGEACYSFDILGGAR